MFNRILSTILLAVTLGACSGGGGSGTSISVGAKDFTEQYILGNLYEIMLDDAGFDASYQSVGGTNENHDAIVAGEIDVYPEYTGTSLLTILGKEFDSNMSADEVYNTVKETYAEQFNLAVLEPTSFNNTYVLTMTEEQADSLGIKTVSDLSQKAD